MNWLIKLSPQFADSYTVLVTAGASLWVDGSEIDLSSIGPGMQAEIEHDDVLGPVKNLDGVMHVTVVFRSPKYAPSVYDFPDENGYSHEGDGEFWLQGGRPNLDFPEGPEVGFVFASTDIDPNAPPPLTDLQPSSIPTVKTKGPLS